MRSIPFPYSFEKPEISLRCVNECSKDIFCRVLLHSASTFAKGKRAPNESATWRSRASTIRGRKMHESLKPVTICLQPWLGEQPGERRGGFNQFQCPELCDQVLIIARELADTRLIE